MPKSTSSNAKRDRAMPRSDRSAPTKKARQVAISRKKTRPATIASKSTAKASEQTAANKARLARLRARRAHRNEVARRTGTADQTSIHFPDEIWLEILSHMTYHSLKKMQVVSKRFHTIIAAPQFNRVLFRPDKNDLAAAAANHQHANRQQHPFMSHGHEFRRYNKKWPSIAGESGVWPPLLRVNYSGFRAPADPHCEFVTLLQYVRWPDDVARLREPKTRAVYQRR